MISPTRDTEQLRVPSVGHRPTEPNPFQLVIMNGPVVAVYTLAQGAVVIGRSRRADIQLPDPAISRLHARLSPGPPFTLEDLQSRHGTFAGGIRLPSLVPVQIDETALITIGNASILLRRLAATADANATFVRYSSRPEPAAHATGQVTLRLGPCAAWAKAPGSSRRILERDPVLRRLLVTLVFHHLRAPGQSMSTTDLVRAVWPEERGSWDAMRNRLYSALSKLRAQGLHDFIVRDRTGYHLLPQLVIQESSEED